MAFLGSKFEPVPGSSVQTNSAPAPLWLLVRVNVLQGWRRLLSVREQSRLLTGIIVLFLGGYLGPGSTLPYVGILISMFWFFLKLGMMICLNIWIRGTWPRVRVDQLMGFAWKILLPMSLINILAAGCWYKYVAAFPNRADGVLAWFICAVFLLVCYVLLSTFGFRQTVKKREYRDSEGKLIATV